MSMLTIVRTAVVVIAATALLAAPATAQSPADLARECDLLAASTNDRTRPADVPGIPASKIDTALAIPACVAALAADPDNPRLTMQLGRANLAAKNYSEARGHYERAASLGNVLAMNDLGILQLDGLGGAKNPEAANAAFRKAAEAGLAIAMRNLGHSYADGTGVAASQEEATRWFEKAAEAGDDGAMVTLGARYEDGTGVAKDDGAARRWYEAASKLQNPAAMNKLATFQFYGRGGPVDFAASLRWYEQAANLGNHEAMYNLGLTYKDGHGVPVDLAAARTWLEKSAALGYSNAMVLLGSFYGTGNGVAQDYAAARRWYEQAAAAGSAIAMYNLGHYEANGRGGPKNMAAAARWYRMAAERGDANAMYWLGVSLTSGDGAVQDYVEARRWFETAVAAGQIDAMVELGDLYETGKGVAPNYTEARRWYMRAADAGSGRGMLYIALLYDKGLGVARSSPEALRWLQKSAETGYTHAMRILAVAHERGEGAKQDLAQARIWYEKAARAGDIEGMTNLARLHASGLGGPRDYAAARRWYGQAADAGDGPSRFMLGGYYERGEGTAKDLHQARLWYERAVAAGHAEARAALARLDASEPVKGRDVKEWAREIIRMREAEYLRDYSQFLRDYSAYSEVGTLAQCNPFRAHAALSLAIYARSPTAFFEGAADLAKGVAFWTAAKGPLDQRGYLQVQRLCLGRFVETGEKQMSYFLARVLFSASRDDYCPYLQARNIIDVPPTSDRKTLISEMQSHLAKSSLTKDLRDFVGAATAALSSSLPPTASATTVAANASSRAAPERRANDAKADTAWLKTLDRLGNIVFEVGEQHVDAPDDRKLVEAVIAGIVRQQKELERHAATLRARAALQAWQGAKRTPYEPLQVLGAFLDELRARPGGLGLSEDQLFEAVGSGIVGALGASARLITQTAPRFDLSFKDVPQSPSMPALTTRAEGNVIYVGLSRISNETVNTLTDQVGGLKRTLQNRVAGYVLDLRKLERDPTAIFSLGVDVDGAVAVADAFLDQGVIAIKQERNWTKAHLAKPGDIADAMPLVVLIGEASIGEADIIAAALKDNGRATLLGTRTLGMGSRWFSISITQTRALEVTAFRVNRPSGAALEGHPIEPDQEVRAASASLDSFETRDNQLQAALARLRSGRRP
jgi:TPR repeat protein